MRDPGFVVVPSLLWHRTFYVFRWQRPEGPVTEIKCEVQGDTTVKVFSRDPHGRRLTKTEKMYVAARYKHTRGVHDRMKLGDQI